MKLSFLPTSPPAKTYSKYSSKSLDRLHDIASNLSKLLLTGTGGTPFMKYLKKHRDETEKQKI